MPARGIMCILVKDVESFTVSGFRNLIYGGAVLPQIVL